MNRDFLKGLLIDDDNINAIMAEIGKEIQAYKSEIEQLRNDIKGKDAIIKNYSTDFEKNVKEEVTKIKNGMLIDNAIKGKFDGMDPLISDLLTSKIDRTKITIDDKGAINGLDDQFTAISEKYKDLFKPKGDTAPNDPNNGGIPGGGTPNGGTDLSKMTYEEYKAFRTKQGKEQ